MSCKRLLKYGFEVIKTIGKSACFSLRNGAGRKFRWRLVLFVPERWTILEGKFTVLCRFLTVTLKGFRLAGILLKISGSYLWLFRKNLQYSTNKTRKAINRKINQNNKPVKQAVASCDTEPNDDNLSAPDARLKRLNKPLSLNLGSLCLFFFSFNCILFIYSLMALTLTTDSMSVLLTSTTIPLKSDTQYDFK